MELYVIRHADAAPLGENNIDVDEDRPLTPKGMEQTKLVAAGLQSKGVALQLILTSPLLRARQTAEGIAKAWTGSPPEIQVCDQLIPGKRPRKLARVLKQLEKGLVAIIGHEPDLSSWTAWMIGSKKAHLSLAKAGVAHVSCENGMAKGGGTLVQLLTPDWLG
ncbi:MAG TPA: phosphohistidine phosphatase SixA [Gemmataceae bacterium]|nr:phosphohistidine phosphatase SixA [Gemmataceae bacterium]